MASEPYGGELRGVGSWVLDDVCSETSWWWVCEEISRSVIIVYYGIDLGVEPRRGSTAMCCCDFFSNVWRIEFVSMLSLNASSQDHTKTRLEAPISMHTKITGLRFNLL